MKKNLFLVLFFIFFLYGCGGGGSASSGIDSSTSVKTAYFYDSAVNGLEYNCGTKITGLTGDSGGDGSFRYQSDCTVEFKIGKIHLGSVAGSSLSSASKIYPTTILGLDNTTIDERVENMLVFLQTLDNDSNLSNGIAISSSTRDTLTNSLFINNSDFVSNFKTTLSDLNTTINTINSVNSTNYLLISKDEALLHFQETLKNTANITINLSNPKPYLVDKYGRTTTLTSIKTANTVSKNIIIKGKADTKIFLAFNSTGSTTGLSFVDTNKTIGSDRNGYLTLDFNDDTISHFHYFIKLVDSDNVDSDILHLDVEKDVIPPHVNSSNLDDINLTEEEFLLQDINATDVGGIKEYRVVQGDNNGGNKEDNRSTHWTDFNISQDGKVRFIIQPSYENSKDTPFQVVVRAIDYVGNMTDVLLKVILENILDNPPQLISNTDSKGIDENVTNGTVVFDVRNLLKSVEEEPDNNSTKYPITFELIDDINGTFAIENNSTGIITIKNKDGNSSLFDYEDLLHNTIDLNVSIKNNNTKYKDENNITQDCNTTCDNSVNTVNAIITVNIQNVIDTAPKLIEPTTLKNIPEYSDDFSNYSVVILLDKNNSDFDDANTTCKIVGGDTSNHFITAYDSVNKGCKIDVNISNTLDYESTKDYNLTIQANNNIGSSNLVHQDINITNVVDVKPIIGAVTPSISIPEDTNTSYLITTFKTIGGAIIDGSGIIHDENNVTTYTIKSIKKNDNNVSVIDSPLFGIDNDGNLTTKRNLSDNNTSDYVENLDANDTVYIVTVNATTYFWNKTDVTGIQYSNDANVTINVSNIIDTAPVLPSTFTIDTFYENNTTQTYDINTSGTTFDTKLATDFNITSGDLNGTFTIDSNGTIKSAKPLNYEDNATHTLKIKAYNYYNNDVNKTKLYSNETIVTVNVKNKIEKAPSLSYSKILNVHENIDIGEVIAIIDINSSSIDERNITGNIKIAGGNDAEIFGISDLKENNTTKLKYAELFIKNKLDFETNSSYTLELNATNEHNTTDINITIKVIDDVDTNLSLLVVMIGYDDINITTSESDMFNKIFSANPPNPPVFGSLNDYFNRVSKEKFIFEKAKKKSGTQNGIVNIKLSTNNVHPQSDINRLEEDIKQALKDINDTNVTFSTFDDNNDSKISKDELQLLFIIAGGEATYGDTNLSIKATSGIFTTPVAVDSNKTLTGNYVIVGEKNGNNPASIGLIAHHLGNTALNFPYLNDRTNASYGIGFFGLMGYGYRGALDSNATIGSTPVNPSAYNILDQGWVHPKVIDKNTTVEMIASNKGIDGFNIIKVPTANSKIYYLLENRVKTNLVGYDDGFFAMENTSFNGGLALWKIDETYEHNDQVNKKLVDLIEYDSNTDIDTKASYGKSSALYHAGNPTYPSNLALPFSISDSSLEILPPTNKMTIDISFP